MIGAFRMNYTAFTSTILAKVLRAMALINNPEIDPQVRQLNQEILFSEVGRAVYAKIYDMNAYDFEIEHTIGAGLDDRFYGLAKVTSASVATGAIGIDQYVKNYLDTTIAMAQRDAMQTARESGKRPTVTRRMNGETCDWCESLAGTYTNPDSEVFKRHRDCDCTIETSGYRSRNGLLGNYVKPKDR